MRPVLILCNLWICLPLAQGADWQAGAAKIDITPQQPIRLSGYGNRTTVAEGIEQPIFARALVLQDSAGVRSALVSVEAIGIPNWIRQRVGGAIRHRTGIYRVHLAVTATHTHYTPVIRDTIENLFVMSPEEERAVDAYSDALAGKIIHVIDDAIEKLAPAKVSFGRTTAGFARNRRTQGGPVDHQLPVLCVRDADDRPMALVFSYACHATTMHAEFNRVSGDWPGYAAHELETAHPGVTALPLIGCGADANPQPRGELAMSKQHGHEIAQRVGELLKQPLKEIVPRLDAQLQLATLRFGSLPTREELQSQLETGPAHVRRLAHRLLGQLAGDGGLPRTYDYPIQAWSLGGDQLVMVFLAGEVVVDYSNRLTSELADRNLWIAAYANDIPAYIPSRRVLKEGGYEAEGSMVYYGQPTRWDPSVEESIVEKTKALVTSVTADTGSRFKPPPPKSPQEALATFALPDGLQIELAAAEPHVADPVAMAFDEFGRMYVCEMRDYPLGPGRGNPADSRVRLLEDKDLDGYFEQSTIFAEHVPFANGITCADGGVFVTAVPQILYLKDTDGDGKADKRQVIYEGFRPGNAQHIVNSLARGLDNWIYAGGCDAAKVRCVPRPDMEPLPLSRTNFRFNAKTLAIEPTTGYRNGFGIAFSERGSRFSCDNQNHVVHVVFGQHELGRNADLRVGQTMNVITDHGAAVYPASTPLERFNDPHDAGRFSSACGIHVFAGDRLPTDYHGSHFVCEPVSNLVHRDVLVQSGATYVATRGESGSEFLTSTDHWFRPVNCATGPDGALYIADMYRQVIEHPEWIPEHVQKQLELRGGKDQGRIYRITGSPTQLQRPGLAQATAGQLIKTLGHPNGWRRETAQRLLVERGESSASIADELARLLDAHSGPAVGRLHALWSLQGLGLLQQDHTRRAMLDPSPMVREHGVVLASTFADAKLAELADDTDPQVRFQVALALGTLPPDRRRDPLARVAIRDAADPWTRTALLTSTDDPIHLLDQLVAAGMDSEGRAALVSAIMDLVGTRKRPEEITQALHLMLDPLKHPANATWQGSALFALLEPLGHGTIGKVLEETGQGTGPLREKLDALFDHVAGQAKDSETPLEERLAAVQLMSMDGSSLVVAKLGELLEPRSPLDLQFAAVRGLAHHVTPEANDILVRAFARLTPRVRGEVLDALIRYQQRRGVLLDAIESGTIRPQDVDVTRRKQLLDTADGALRERAEQLFSQLEVESDRAALVDEYRQKMEQLGRSTPADAGNGEMLFVTHCAKCHRIGDQGIAVGADLTAAHTRSVDALIVDILDPSRAVAPEFVNYSLVTHNGQVLSGLLAAETPVSIVLRGAEGKNESILRRDIDQLRATGKSVMPEGLEQQLTPQQLRDVIAYLRSGAAGRTAEED